MNSCLIFTMKTTSGEEAREQHTGDSALSFNQVDPGDQTQVLRLGGKCHCLLSYVTSQQQSL